MTPSPVVLVVDDVEDSRELYVQYLSFVGYRLFSAANGLAGLELAALHNPDVVILDLSMPGMDGWDVCQRLKSQPSPPRVIVVTGHGLRGTPQTDRELPCDAYFLKPCLPDDLESEIRRQLQPRAA
ncbi:MAG: hypothetical protein AUH30_00815 [Candidatus Rokubacteria bacterium 13_1_40CM_68_15]|nr:MAG: hypothetical protein AUH30_00815 [Candidatus Rokubacteria bacterium 13_1_40CM_68_15]